MLQTDGSMQIENEKSLDYSIGNRLKAIVVLTAKIQWLRNQNLIEQLKQFIKNAGGGSSNVVQNPRKASSGDPVDPALRKGYTGRLKLNSVSSFKWLDTKLTSTPILKVQNRILLPFFGLCFGSAQPSRAEPSQNFILFWLGSAEPKLSQNFKRFLGSFLGVVGPFKILNHLVCFL